MKLNDALCINNITCQTDRLLHAVPHHAAWYCQSSCWLTWLHCVPRQQTWCDDFLSQLWETHLNSRDQCGPDAASALRPPTTNNSRYSYFTLQKYEEYNKNNIKLLKHSGTNFRKILRISYDFPKFVVSSLYNVLSLSQSGSWKCLVLIISLSVKSSNYTSLHTSYDINKWRFIVYTYVFCQVYNCYKIFKN